MTPETGSLNGFNSDHKTEDREYVVRVFDLEIQISKIPKHDFSVNSEGHQPTATNSTNIAFVGRINFNFGLMTIDLLFCQRVRTV